MAGNSCGSKRNLSFLGFGGREARRVSCGEDCGATGWPWGRNTAEREGLGSDSLLLISTWDYSKAIFSPCISQHLKCLAPQTPPATPLPWTGGHWESLPTSCSELGYVCGSQAALASDMPWGGLVL